LKECFPLAFAVIDTETCVRGGGNDIGEFAISNRLSGSAGVTTPSRMPGEDY
jgi:hypothetical protein